MGTDTQDVLMRSLIADAIEEHEQTRKKQKTSKSVRFRDEDEVYEIPTKSGQDQEGPVKEHLLEEVYQKRQRTREAPQSAEAPEADQLDDRTNRFEGQFNASAASLSWSGDAEDEKLQELDGEQLSEFNMDREREEGFDLETLEMTRGKGEEEELAKDPWLASLQQEHAVQEELDNGIVRAKVRRSQMVVSEDVRRRHQTEQALLDSKEPLPEAEMAAARRNLIKHMLPRETVMQALTRLGGKRSQNPAARHRLGKQQVSEEEARRKALIEQFTDAATTLMSGEADIFEQHREELQHALQMQEVLAPRPEQGVLAGADSGDDMFADSDEEGPEAIATPAASPLRLQEAPSTSGGHNAATDAVATGGLGAEQGVTSASEPTPPTDSTRGGGPAVGAIGGDGDTVAGVADGVQEAAAGSETAPAAAHEGVRVGVRESLAAEASGDVDYTSWPVSELKRMLQEAGVDVAGMTEKEGLVEAAKAVEKARGVHEVPVGFVMDPNSGYFFNFESGWYFHAESGSFYKDGKWYGKDEITGELWELHKQS